VNWSPASNGKYVHGDKSAKCVTLILAA